MSESTTNAFEAVIEAHNRMRADRDLHERRLNDCRDILINMWRMQCLPPVVAQLNETLQKARYTMRVEDGLHAMHPPSGKPFLEYGMTRTHFSHTTEKSFPKLRFELHDDLMAHSNIKTDAGPNFFMPLEGEFETDTAVQIFAAFLRECMSRN